ncbi:MAG: tetratricopeptide repeat protein [Lautropia sp.]
MLAQSWAGDARTGSGAPARTTPQARAQDALAAGEPARALEIVDQASKTFPADPQLRFLRGLALSGLKRAEEAEAVFRGLTQEYPELPEPHNNLAFVLAAQGKLEAARSALEAAIAALPDYALAHENLGDIQLQLAARSYREAARLAPRAGTSAARKLEAIERLQAAAPPPARP